MVLEICELACSPDIHDHSWSIHVIIPQGAPRSFNPISKVSGRVFLFFRHCASFPSLPAVFRLSLRRYLFMEL